MAENKIRKQKQKLKRRGEDPLFGFLNHKWLKTLSGTATTREIIKELDSLCVVLRRK